MEFIRNLKKVWVYTRKQKNKLILYVLCSILSMIISVVVPVISAQIIINLTTNMLEQVLLMSLVLMLVEWSRNVANYGIRFFSQVIYRETFIDVQNHLGSEMLRLENTTLDQNSSGVFIQRLTNDTSRIADIFGILNNNLSNIIADIGIFSAVFIINKIAFIYLIVIVIILYIVERVRTKKRNENDKAYRQNHEKVSGFIGELVRGARDIKMLNAEKSFMTELKSQIASLNQQKYKMGRTDRNYSFIRGMLMDLFDAGVIFLLVFLIMEGSLEVANALVIHNYMSHVVYIINYASNLMENIKDFNLSCERIFAIIDSPEFKKEKFGNNI